MFATIRKIEEVHPHIENKDEFKITENSGYDVIDYQVQKPDTFDSLMSLELRGIKFHKNGCIAARPLHKKFNLGEYPSTDQYYLEQPYRMYEKIDGSLIHFLPVNGELRAMTKAGITEVSKQCEQEVDFHPDFWSALQDMLDIGLTPCFEYTSPNNRIVIRYDQPQMTLIAVRDAVTGVYHHLDDYANVLHVPRVREYTGTLEDVKDWTEKEGVVLVFEDGHRIKCKSDDYILKHRTKDSLSQEKNVLQLVLKQEIDDLANILDEKDYNAIRKYSGDVHNGIEKTEFKIRNELDRLSHLDRKHVALNLDLEKNEKSIFWQCYQGADPFSATVDFLLKKCGNQSNVDANRNLFNAYWNY